MEDWSSSLNSEKITIIGSYNVGLFLKGKVLPKKGETVIGHTFHEGGGGKGSNQAITASCLGADVTFIGRIGRDKYGDDALGMYDRYGVSSKYISVDEAMHTGISVILIDDTGANLISVVPGANFKLSKQDIDVAEEELRRSYLVGFQLESNFDIVEYGLKKCSKLGVPTLLDPAPAKELPDSIFPAITYIKPNEHEASIITGIEVTDKASAKEAGKWLIDKGITYVIITLGEQGAVFVSENRNDWFPSLSVRALDTTGAGDCFSGGFMTALSKGASIDDAIGFANCAAGLSVTKIGVIESIPTREELDRELEKIGLQELRR